jgi:hypothetical protein
MIFRGSLRGFTAGALGALLLAGCGSSTMSRIDANRGLYESWPLDVQEAVLNGNVVTGMTPDMVEMAIGKPTEVESNTQTGSNEEIWVYRKGGSESGTGSPLGSPLGPNTSVGMGMGPVGLNTSPMGMRVGTGMGTMIGPNMGIGTGVSMPISGPSSQSPQETREIVFRDGVVYRADPPP